jgi:serine/threonine-protein kinase
VSELRRFFEQVCDLPEAEQESALRAAGASGEIVAQVAALLRADAATRTLVRAPVSNIARDLLESTELGPGDLLGAWRLLREIGHGGMGAVYLAERADGAFEQQVAIKLIRGAADAQMIVRFTRERQLLAHLQHPQIARLLDGGSTPTGQPYFVMEFVAGRSLGDWCSQTQPDLAARLQLMASIARAVQYAHQQLIVHCDLKPSNIIVRADGTPILLDFGVGQALDRSDDDVHSVSELRRYLTPRYASPEQLRGEPAGIATDIFSLGLLLGELVSGRTPRRETTTSATPLATIGRPSDEATSEVAWRRDLRGDIDAIVQRACASDPAQRYGSAAALAEDLDRIGRHEPVSARATTWSYVGARLLRRRWPVFLGASAMLLISALFTWRTILAEREARRDAETARQVSDFLVSVFAVSDTNVNQQAHHELTAREVLDRGAERIRSDLREEAAVRARLLVSLGDAYRHMGLDDRAAALLQEAVELYRSPAVDQPLAAAATLTALANTYANGEFPAGDAERAARESLQMWQQHTRGQSVGLANAWMVLSLGLNAAGKSDEALDAAKTALAMLERLRAPDGRRFAALNNLGMISSRRGDHDAAKKHYRSVIDGERQAGLAETGSFAIHLNNYATALERNSELVESIATQREAVQLAARLYGETGGNTIAYRGNLARKLTAHGDYVEARTMLTKVLEDSRRIHGAASAEVFNAELQIANVYSQLGQFELAAPLYRQVFNQRRAAFAGDDPRVLRAATLLARALVQVPGGIQEARGLLPAFITAARAHGEKNVDLQAALVAQATVLFADGQLSQCGQVLADVQLDGRTELWTRVQAWLLHAQLATVANDDKSATAFTEQAWQAVRAALGADHPQVARLALALAKNLRVTGDSARAKVLEDAARPVFDRTFPADSSFRASII